MKHVYPLLYTLVLIAAWSSAWCSEQPRQAMQGMSAAHPTPVMPSILDRDPHASADGYDFGPIPRPRFADERRFASLLVDRLEYVHTADSRATAYDLQGWYGRDYNRIAIRAEGDIDRGTLQQARTELAWEHAISAFWNTQLGIRYDSGTAPDRSWLVIGANGLAPYWFDVDAAVYVGAAGRAALRVNADYELLLTQKWILQPRLETSLYSRKDAGQQLGAGLADLTTGLRLRYEIRREFAPYIGIEWLDTYGDTAEYALNNGNRKAQTRYVAGLRFWF